MTEAINILAIMAIGGLIIFGLAFPAARTIARSHKPSHHTLGDSLKQRPEESRQRF